jgi:hypothetical protein
MESANRIIWYRTPSQDQQFPGVNVPSISTCSLLNTSVPDNTLINFQRNIDLFDINSNGQLLTFTENLSNQINLDPETGDNTVVEFTDTFIRNFEPVVPFLGNPPLAVADSFTISLGIPTTENVISNDIQGGATIDPTTVTIVTPPQQGTATVNPTTGEITYTSDPGFTGTTDSLQYRVLDMNGNESTIGFVIFTDGAGV